MTSPPPVPSVSGLPPNTTVEAITVHRLTSFSNRPFEQVISSFRTLVPQIDLRKLSTQTNAQGIEDVVRSTNTSSGFALFAEFNHGRWIQFFPAQPKSPLTSSWDESSRETLASQGTSMAGIHGGKGLMRFIFGNPLVAATMLKHDVEAGLHVPVECCFVEQEDGSTKLITLLPSGLIAGHDQGLKNRELREAVGKLEDMVLRLVEDVMSDRSSMML